MTTEVNTKLLILLFLIILTSSCSLDKKSSIDGCFDGVGKCPLPVITTTNSEYFTMSDENLSGVLATYGALVKETTYSATTMPRGRLIISGNNFSYTPPLGFEGVKGPPRTYLRLLSM
jgi:hypothetical protein